MDADTLELHPVYGLNPTIPVCAYCHKEKGYVVLLGNTYKEQAPVHMVADLEPCEECQKKFSEGILLVEVKDKESLEPLQYTVITEEAAKRMFTDTQSELLETLLERRRALVEKGTFDRLGIKVQEEKETTNEHN